MNVHVTRLVEVMTWCAPSIAIEWSKHLVNVRNDTAVKTTEQNKYNDILCLGRRGMLCMFLRMIIVSEGLVGLHWFND